MSERIAELNESILSEMFRPCGLNADWSFSAWCVSKGEPNRIEGGVYILEIERDDEQGRRQYVAVRRWHERLDEDGNEVIEELCDETHDLARVVEVARWWAR